MRSFEVTSSRGTYSVVVGQQLLEQLASRLAAAGVPQAAAVVSNQTVGPLYGRRAAAGLGLEAALELPDGEQHKRWPQVESICAWLLEHGVHRTDLLMALGGGVVTDLAGFAAAVYLRGIDWIAVPTTLLAMVDASVGGKTGINLDQGKNLAGCFWPPRLVLADVDTLATLPPRELRAGLAEAIKSAWIGDQGLLDLLDRPIGAASDLDAERWQELVARAVAVKIEIVAADETETGRRQALNLGHTVGHALEAATAYRRFVHGEAVAWGMLAEARIAARRGLLGTASEQRLASAIATLGELPPIDDLGAEQLLGYIASDKKRDDLGVAWVLPTDEGVVLGQRVSSDEVAEVMRGFGCSA